MTADTTRKDLEYVPYTATGDAFGPLPKHMNQWGKDPEAPVLETIEGLHDHPQDLAGDVGEASDLAEALVSYAAPKVQPLLWAIAGQAARAEQRLNEAIDALHAGHTENVGHRLEGVGVMTLHLESVASLALETHERSDGGGEMVSGVLCSAFNAIEYTRKRLDHLVYEADLPL